MKIAALSLFALSLVSASPVKRQASSAVESIVASATSAIESVSSAAGASVSSAAPSASASADFGTGLLNALRERQATTLASLLEPLAGQLVPTLQSGEWTIFAPGNEYLANVDTSNQTALANILEYHIVAGNYPTSELQTNASNIAPTLVNATMLGANYTKLPLAFTKDVFGTTVILGQNDTRVLGNSTYQNILIKLIDGVLMPPGNIVEVISANNGSALISTLTSALPNVASTLQNAQGVTVFAPDNAAINAAAPLLTSLVQSNMSAVASVVEGHVIPSVVFSSNITNGLVVQSLAGTTLTFTTNSTGVFVEGNGVTAQITQPDLIASNGVAHTINALLFNPPANPTASSASGSMSASSAVASALPSTSA